MEKTILRLSLLTCCLLVFSFTSFGQKNITGQVVDANDLTPLPGVTVIIKGTQWETITNSEGKFRIKTGRDTDAPVLLFRCLGYKETAVKAPAGRNDLGQIGLPVASIGLDEIEVLASFVNPAARKPMKISTLSAGDIETRLGNQEFPEILKNVPSVYTTRQGGGMGDARIGLRGFGSENIGLLINGIPVNGMENGAVYWSNWAGLADVTQSIQVQRGLGASKLGIPSVGGTINIITRSIDAETGGSVYYGTGNDGYRKLAFNVSTGLMKNGWALTLAGSHTKGDGYVRGTGFEGWSYFVNLSKRINADHLLSFTAFGAPQWHNMRADKHYIADYENHRDGIRMNTNYGYWNGQVLATQGGYNEYHKPQLSLNHFWTVDDRQTWSTSVYFSKSKGGGRSTYGNFNDRKVLQYDNATGRPFAETALTPDGLIDYNKAMGINRDSEIGSKAIFVMGTNAHEWYGALSSYTNDLNDYLRLTAGIDVRYYKGYHYQKISDLLGGAYYKDNRLAYRDPALELGVGDKVGYDNTSRILWTGGFAQLELTRPAYNAFASLSLTNHMYKRVDPGTYGEFGNQTKYPASGKKTNWIHFVPVTAKAGFSYNLSEIHQVFVNGGYVTKAPTFDGVFPNKDNTRPDDLHMEKIGTFELGYSLHTRDFGLSISGYFTRWLDKTYSQRIVDQYYNIAGADATHKGLEIEAFYRPLKGLTLGGNFALGDWKWTDDIAYIAQDESGRPIEKGEYHAYIDGLHVGNAPQTSAAIWGKWEPFEGFQVGANWNYFGRNYANFDLTKRTDEADRADSWKMPDFSTVDVNMNYRFRIGKLKADLFGTINNLFNKEYISDAMDGTDHKRESALVWYGFGTTWTAGLRVAF